ncbi:hypothetical protein SAMN04487992_1362 [Cellulophaga baltica]|uniref:DUF1579 domain-containing protein n=2 Tax=Cellulophaga baltica TaxID=76594 RepID=A0A1G7M8V0_9FLAO|nr:hypothetical protein SAMN04487992_1362 [Cellulophaga baltica]
MSYFLIIISLINFTTLKAQNNMNQDETLKIPELQFDQKGELIITASSTSSEHDFDFYEGKWKLHNRKLKTKLEACTEWIEFESTQEMYKILNGIGNIDNYLATFDGKPFEGMSVRLFNPKTKLWCIYWADSNQGILQPGVFGSFENDIAHFFTKDNFNGKEIFVVFRWDVRDKDNPIWSQAFSEDKGKTWEWNWYMFFSKFNEK